MAVNIKSKIKESTENKFITKKLNFIFIKVYKCVFSDKNIPRHMREKERAKKKGLLDRQDFLKIEIH